ncbi:MAG: hypothetical protein PW786_04195 [Arachidicoccus sp.]|nr:hypothetical protein [Arachidicoccus sp.]
MKKLLFLSFAALCFTAATVHAQDSSSAAGSKGWQHPPRGGGFRGGNDEKLIKELNLTADQKTQFKAIDDAQKSKFDSLRNAGGSREDQRATFMAIIKESNDKKRAILTPDQQTKFDAYQKEREERMKAMRQHGGDNGGGNQ